MSGTNYGKVFGKAFRERAGATPYTYQCRLACGAEADLTNPETLKRGTPCQSQLIEIPTGLGKTAAVVLAWLWNRVLQPDIQARKAWPRRLVYCLPMRTLVEQTRENVEQWLKNLWENADELELDIAARKQLEWLKENSPIILMGGEDAKEWDIYPEKDAILIGTQDMLLSRALNRGYGMSRYRWPIHFGLLNNGCLWVMDETQLMGPGLATASQLEAFRRGNTPGSIPRGYGSIPDNRSVTWYMSATSSPELLRTREWRDVPRAENLLFEISSAEKAADSGELHQRRFAAKGLELRPELSFGDSKPSETIIAAILARHGAMLSELGRNAILPARTVIVCNTVDRAISVHSALAASELKGCDLLLLHSRFRPPEREAQMKRIKSTDLVIFPRGQIIVATQVIEAGVDLSSAILWSEVAPLSSLVQRLGRLNRHGEFSGGKWAPVSIIVGVGTEAESGANNEAAKQKIRDDNAKRSLPYDSAACETAWDSLSKLKGNASPANFETIRSDISASIPRCPYSLQRHELMDFFDSDANLSLGFTDVSPFVRGMDEETDVQVLWRDSWPQNDNEPAFMPDFQRNELCSVPIGKAFKGRAVLDQGWLWRGKEGGWISVRDSGIAPGMTILLPLSAGGYDMNTGWTGETKDNKHSSRYEAADEASDEDLLSCLANGWQSIAVHTAEVAAELETLWKATVAEETYPEEYQAFVAAGPWHDIGKNHPGWQQAVVKALTDASISGKDEHRPFAKFSLSDCPTLDGLSGEKLEREVNRLRRSFRPGIAHEVASALAFRQSEQARFGKARPVSSLLTEYLIMTHHGRVRKVLRDEIPRFPHDAKDNDTVRGVVDGSAIPTVSIDGESLGCAFLSTDCRRMGRDTAGNESYTRGVLRLLEAYGPFRLAFFEAVFRAADVRASKSASKRPNA